MMLIFITFFASIVGTISGFGLSTIMIPILITFLSLEETLLFVGIIHWWLDVGKIVFFNKKINWQLLYYFGLPGIGMSIVGAYFVFLINQEVLLQIFGLFLIAYIFFLMFYPSFKLDRTTFSSLIGGSISGFLAGLFGLGGAVRGLFLSLYDLPKFVYIATSGAIALLIDSGRLMIYWYGGLGLSPSLYKELFFCIPVSLLGIKTAQLMVIYIPQRLFRFVIAVFLFLLGIKLLLKL